MSYTPSILIGVAAAMGAAVLLSSGTVLQAMDVRRVDQRHGARISLLGTLLSRPLWLAGTVVGYLAFPLQLLALMRAPLVLVQPVHAVGLVLLMAVGVRLLRERVATRDLLAILGIVVGIGMIAWGAPRGGDQASSELAFAAATGALVLAALVPLCSRSECGRITLMVSAGLGFAGANMAVKGLTDHLSTGGYLLAGGYLAVAAVASTAAVTNQMAAFQRLRAVDVVPVTFGLPIFLPALLAVFVLHDRWSSAAFSGAPFAVGCAILLAGTAALARSAPVVQLSHGGRPAVRGASGGAIDGPIDVASPRGGGHASLVTLNPQHDDRG
jgi:drug/metabolite transporter (DMT)-like permease